MTHQPFTPPAVGLSSFNCPHCNAYSAQAWGNAVMYFEGITRIEHMQFSKCSHCSKVCLWLDRTMVFPDSSPAPLPNSDIPEEIKKDYEEARCIINKSPRGAAALLRLCIQKLCAHLGEPGKNINDDISSLVKKGLSAKIQKSLDIVRLFGNEAVHPGTINIKDNPELKTALRKNGSLE